MIKSFELFSEVLYLTALSIPLVRVVVKIQNL